MKIVKQIILAAFIVFWILFLFYQGFVKADNHCREVNVRYADYRFCMGI